MTNEQPINQERFVKRLSDLCLRSALPGLPKDDLNRQILLKSAALMLDANAALTEKSVNEGLAKWISGVGHIDGVDFVSMRRALVDDGYLDRAKDGTNYRVVLDPRPDLFDKGINQLDIPTVISEARDEIARRKQAYLEKAAHN